VATRGAHGHNEEEAVEAEFDKVAGEKKDEAGEGILELRVGAGEGWEAGEGEERVGVDDVADAEGEELEVVGGDGLGCGRGGRRGSGG
jgi:hypothetical protein